MISVYGKTDKGLKREENQDAFSYYIFDDNSVFAILCDGMGGANAGSVASRKTVEIIEEYFKKSFRPNITENTAENILRSAVESANIKLYKLSSESDDLSGMGTTVVAAYITGQNVYIIHAGDSRAYLLSKNAISQITSDHSVVQNLVDLGEITLSEAKIHPEKNIITKAIGVKPEISADFNTVKLEQGDKILLCSDGLTNFVDDSDILSIVSDDTKISVNRLIEAANKSGGGDNITAVMLSI